MAAPWNTVRVFISSTFRDMQAERDHLVRFVFPRVRDRLLTRRIHLVDVDLRWGVTGDQDTSDVCRAIIDECRPRFLCLLGGRYGTILPGKDQSITAEEIHYGVLDEQPEKTYGLFYFRQGAVTVEMDRLEPGTFREARHSDKAKRLAQLKRDIRNTKHRQFLYRPRWNAKEKRVLGLKALGERVEADIIATIDDEFGTHPPEQLDQFEEESAAMAAFVIERSQRFVIGSREPELEALVAHAGATDGKGYLRLTGEPGSGKSALLAHFVTLAVRSGKWTVVGFDRPKSEQAASLLIPHFVGASTNSTDMHHTVRRLCHQLRAACRQTNADIPEDTDELSVAFLESLRQACKSKQVVILLDAVNQLDAALGSSTLYWLPEELPAKARVIYSTLARADDTRADMIGSGRVGDTVAPLEKKLGSKLREIQLKPLTSDDRRGIVQRFCEHYSKHFEPEQIEFLLGKDKHGNLNKADSEKPLYLLTALEELRTFGTYEEITQRITELPPTTHELFAWILERLGNDDGFRDSSGLKIGGELVQRFASLLGVSRHGLSQKELVELLAPGNPGSDPPVPDDAQGNVAALLSLIRPYMMRRGELVDFYHGEFRTAVNGVYLNDNAQVRSAHAQVAVYFRRKSDPIGDGSWGSQNSRYLTELPFHLSRAFPDSAAGLCSILTDLRYLDARINASDVYGLMQDYNLYGPPEGLLKAHLDLLRRNAQRLNRHHGAFLSLVYHEGPPEARQEVSRLAQTGLLSKPWFRIEAAWLPDESRSYGRESVAVRAAHLFDFSSAAGLADNRELAFYVARLGKIRLVDLERFVELPATLSVRQSRALCLAVSDDAHRVALAYDDGEVEVYRLDLADDATFLVQWLASTFTYLVPESDAPVFVWDNGVLWYQPDLASIGRIDFNVAQPCTDVIPLPSVTYGELSGFVARPGAHVVTLRLPRRTTSVVELGQNGASETLRLHDFVVTAACTCGADDIALGSTSGTVDFYRPSSDWTRVARAESSNPPACFAWNGSSLAWISEQAHFQLWDPSDTGPPRDLGRFPDLFPSNRLVTARRLRARPDGSYDAITDSGVFQFAVTAGSDPKSYRLRAVLQGPDGTSYGVQERDGEDWFLDLTSRKKWKLESFDSLHLPFFCAIDGTGQLLAASVLGGAHLFDLVGGRWLMRVITPPGVAAVVGHPESGFWMVDRAGTIMAITAGGCTRAAALELASPGGAQLCCGRGHLVWSGTCLNATADCTSAIVGFRVQAGRAEPLGERVFAKSDGTLRSLDLSPEDDLVVAVFEGSARSPMSLRIGNSENFVRGCDVERVLNGIDLGVSRARIVSGGSAVDLLCASGAMYRVDIATGRTVALLSVSEPITDLAIGPTRGASLLLAQSNVRPLTCILGEANP